MDGYVVFPVKITSKSEAVRQLFIKLHEPKERILEKPNGRTLVVLNIPPLVTEDALKNALGLLGDIEKIWFQREPSDHLPVYGNSKFFPAALQPSIESYRVAYVVYTNGKGLKMLKSSIPSEPIPLFDPSNESATAKLVSGVRLWQNEYNQSVIDPQELKDEIDVYMAEYDANVEREKQQEKELENVPDADGWIKVTSHGKKRFNPNNEIVDKAILSKTEKKRQKQERSMQAMSHFYSYKHKEGKLNKISELRKKFAEDKQRIASLKSSRKFKP